MEELLGSLGSRRDSAAHFPSFFMSFSPDAPMHAIASICLRPLQTEREKSDCGAFPMLSKFHCFLMVAMVTYVTSRKPDRLTKLA